MNDHQRFFRSCAVLTVAVVAPLAHAERTWWYAVFTLAAAVVGWHTTVRRDRPLLGPRGSYVFVVAAFIFLILECGVLGVTPVLALAHFMVLVCASKLVQRRGLRDDAQMLILSLLLLVVDAVVSGSVLFLAVLVIGLTSGFDALIRLHVALERSRVEQRQQEIHSAAVPLPDAGARALRCSLLGPISGAALFAVAAGLAIFVLCPRVGAGMFGRFEHRFGGPAVTGFAATLDFNTIGPLQESEYLVMRVELEGRPAENPDLYLRGAVLSQYHCERPRNNSGWQWRRFDADPRVPHAAVPRYADQADGAIALVYFYSLDVDPEASVCVQHIALEPTRDQRLFACFCPVELRAPDVRGVGKWVDEHILETRRMPPKVLRYTVTSVSRVTSRLAQALAAERLEDRMPPEPVALQPDTPLPRAAEINRLIDRLTVGVGPLDRADNRREFARRIERYLRSREFAYSAELVPVHPGIEPVGHFLLETRRGHCEYFASAMAVMCQLRGIPARVVNGYHGGDYNPVGDFYLVRGKHAHSWVEVFIPGREWVTFDPTPADPGRQDPAQGWLQAPSMYLDYLQYQWANLVVSYDSGVRSDLLERFDAWLRRPTQSQRSVVGAVAAFVRELFSWRLALSWRERLVYWVFSLLVVALVVLLGYVLAVVGWWVVAATMRRLAALPHLGGRGSEVHFYQRFCRRLATLGLRRHPGQTPAEFARDLASRFPDLREAPHLVDAYYAVAFGGRALPPFHQARIEAFLDRLGRLASDRLGVSVEP